MRSIARGFSRPSLSLLGFVTLAFVLSSALSGCTDGDGDAAPPVAGDDRIPEELADAVGPLRLAMVRPDSFRPDELVQSDQSAVILADLLYDGLVEVDGATGELVPALARRWSSNEDFTRWTFELDPTTGVDAETAAASLATLVRSSSRTPVRSRSMAALTAGMTSVTAADATTVVIELAGPNAGLPWVLSGLPYSVVGLDGEPSGRYEFVFDVGSDARLRRRTPDGLAGSLAGALDRSSGRSSSNEIEITWTDTGADAYRLLVDGAADGAVAGPSSLSDAGRRFGWEAMPTSALRYYVVNRRSPDLADLPLRAEVLGAIDPQGVIDGTGATTLMVVDGLVSPSAAGYHPAACAEDCRDDVIADRSTADERLGGSPLAVSYAGDEQEAMAAAVADQLTASGLAAAEVEVSAHDLAAAIVEGTTDLFAFGWVAPAGSVDAVLPPLLGADSPANVARIADPAIQELLDRAARTADDDERWGLLDEAHRLGLAEAKIVPIAVSSSTLVLSDQVVGLSIRADGSIDVETVG